MKLDAKDSVRSLSPWGHRAQSTLLNSRSLLRQDPIGRSVAPRFVQSYERARYSVSSPRRDAGGRPAQRDRWLTTHRRTHAQSGIGPNWRNPPVQLRMNFVFPSETVVAAGFAATRWPRLRPSQRLAFALYRLASNALDSEVLDGEKVPWPPPPLTAARWGSRGPQKYTCARDVRADIAFGEQILDIADDTSEDWKTAANGREVVNKELVLRSKLRIEARQFHMSRLHPQQWGDRQQIDVKSDTSVRCPKKREYVRRWN